MRNLTEANVLVTGAADGLGRRVAPELAEGGATVLQHVGVTNAFVVLSEALRPGGDLSRAWRALRERQG